MSCIFSSYFFLNDTATTEIYTLSLHDALPICVHGHGRTVAQSGRGHGSYRALGHVRRHRPQELGVQEHRSEEHTSELQSHSDLVCRLLLEKKNKKNEKKRTLNYKHIKW